MTDTRLTQIAVEEFASGTPALQATQVALEEWATVQTTNPQMAATMIALEQWASVAVAGGGTQARAMVLA